MKTFKKIALVSAIAAAPFAAQAMEALDDSVLGNTTGQAGVTIEISVGDAGISVGEITYTDTDTAADTDGGSVVMQNLKISGINKLTQTIDVSEEGNLVMGMKGSDALFKTTLNADGTLTETADTAGNGVKGIQISLGGNKTVGTPAVTTNYSAVMLQSADGSAQAELVNALTMDVDLGDSTTTIFNLSSYAGTEVLAVDEVVEVVGTDGPDGIAGNADDVLAVAPVAAVAYQSGTFGALSNAGVIGDHATDTAAMAIKATASFRINDLDVGVFGYTNAQANTKVAESLAAANEGTSSSDYLDADGNLLAIYASATLPNGKTGAENVAAAANSSAIDITNLSFTGTDGGLVTANQTIWAVGGDASLAGSKAGVYIQVGSIAGNLNIGSIAIGGSSIGSVSVSDINLAGMTQRIYGH